jgi:hypothetical protein
MPKKEKQHGNNAPKRHREVCGTHNAPILLTRGTIPGNMAMFIALRRVRISFFAAHDN